MAGGQCWVALQHFQGCHPETRPEYSELFHMIGLGDPTLLEAGRSTAWRLSIQCRCWWAIA